MSLLEDVFLQDEADEAQELERVIEGDEYDERPRSRSVTPEGDENNIGDDEAEEDKRRVDPNSTKTKRVIKNPRFILNPARLTGPRGIQVIREHFKDFKFKGKGHEKEDLDMVLKKLEHWAYRLYPKFQFDDCLKKIESLGKKRPVMVHLSKIRSDQILTEETVVQKDSSDEETQNEPPQEEDEFDKLLQQQIAIARATPGPGSVKKVMDTPRQDRSPFTMPKATSSPSISDEQKERMIRNRKLAEERRLARLEKMAMEANTSPIVNNIDIEENNVTTKKHNRSNVIDSSDEECNVTAVNQSVSVDMHTNSHEKEAINKSIESQSAETEQTIDIDMDHNNESEKDKSIPTIDGNQISDQVEKDNNENIEDNGEESDKNFEGNHINQENEKTNNELSQKGDILTENPNEPHLYEENKVKSPLNNVIYEEGTLENNITEDIQTEGTQNTETEGTQDTESEGTQDTETEGRQDSETKSKDVLNEKEIVAEVVEDIMDVDFSDDF